jgi:uncharacterized protein involved in type VI secretion and phage assembly
VTVDEQTIRDLIDHVRSRFYGKYRGSVTQVDAPTMRIKAKVPAVLGETESGWCAACVPFAGQGIGLAFLPEVGTGVWIEFEAGDPTYPIWSGFYWRQGEAPSDAAAEKRVLVTQAKAKLIFDDDGQTVTLSDESNNTVELSSSGIKISHGGKSVAIGDASVDVNDTSLKVT